MIILYVPFTRDNAGDLADGVDLWKQNHKENSNIPIVIIYHQDIFKYKDIDDKSEIYICVHGNDLENLTVGNHSSLERSDLISIKTVSERLDHDFLYISHKIADIHLYCCGNQRKNHNLAKILQAHLSRPENSTIHFYKGTLTVPDRNGTKWSVEGDSKIPIQNTEQRVDILTPKSPDSPEHRKSVKHNNVYNQRREIRRNRMFAQIKDDRYERMSAFRIRVLEEIDSNTFKNT